MDRLNDADVDTSGRLAFWRQFNVEGASIRGEDDDLRGAMMPDGTDLGVIPLDQELPEGALWIDRRDREHVVYFKDTDGKWKPQRLKRDDDVTFAGMPCRVLGPAAGRDWVFLYNESWFGELRLPCSSLDITDRAPVDPSDQPAFPVYELTPLEDAPPVDPTDPMGGTP